jgi:hypothetical protein
MSECKELPNPEFHQVKINSNTELFPLCPPNPITITINVEFIMKSLREKCVHIPNEYFTDIENVLKELV